MVHCHDWQTGLIPVLLKDKFREGEFFCNMKSVITIHNLKFQGVWDVKTIKRFTELPDYYFTPDKLEAYKDGNLLKAVSYLQMPSQRSATHMQRRLSFHFMARDWTA